MSDFKQEKNDLGILPKIAKGIDDLSFVLAEEERLNTESLFRYGYVSRGSSSWVSAPSVSQDEVNRSRIKIQGRAFFPVYPAQSLDLNFEISVPPLENVSGTIDREDVFYLLGITSEVGAAQDPKLGQLEFSYRLKNEETEEEEIHQTLGENSRRMRAFIIGVLAPENLTPESFLDAIKLPSSETEAYQITVLKDGIEGWRVGGYHLWAVDENLVEAKAYPIFPQYVDILPVAKIRRKTVPFTPGGGDGGTETEIIDKILDPETSQEDRDLLISSRIMEILAGYQYSYRKTVVNLGLGPVASNPDAPGEPAIASNGSSLIANGQRIPFTDQAWTDEIFTARIVAENDGSDRALVSLALSQSVPPGTSFSQDLSRHKIFSLNGEDVSAQGRFTRLGQSGVLTWIAGDKQSSIQPGQTCLICPAINYPSGSGFKIPFKQVLRAWQKGQLLHIENIREAGLRDLDQYEKPLHNNPFIVMVGRERSALHYIYQDVVVQSSNTGVLAIPETARGCFAFIEGVQGRVDLPVVVVDRKNAPYRALIYHPPRLEENWQFELSHPNYQGSLTGIETVLNGSQVYTNPVCVLHTQGGGNAVHRGEASLRFIPVAKHLPLNEIGIPPYEAYGPIHLAGTPYPGPITYSSIPLSPASGLALPRLGQMITHVIESHHQYHYRSLRGRLMVDGATMGYRIPTLNHQYPCQVLVSFAVRKNEDIYLFIATHNSLGGASVEIDSSKNTAFDLFKL